MSANVLPLPVADVSHLVEHTVATLSISTRWLTDGDHRLDAAYYSDEVSTVRRRIHKSKLETRPLEALAQDIFAAPISSRFFAPHGAPYLLPSQVFDFRPTPRKFVIAHKLTSPGRWFVKPGWILVSQSGVVGRVGLATNRLAEIVVSQNLLRIVPAEAEEAGYLYAFLSSTYGQTLMTHRQFGGTVSHLVRQHLADIPVPLLAIKVRRLIHERILSAYGLRDVANSLLDRADGLLHAELGLSPFDESQIPYIAVPNAHRAGYGPTAFALTASELAGRLDVSFHLPVAKACVEQMGKGKHQLVQLGDIAKPYVAPRFRRIYVGAEHGVPFLQGSHIPMMKAYDLKYLSRRAHADLSPWTIQEGWVLVTCSGTIGRVALVPKGLAGWAASQHIERIIPDTNRAHPGYIAAFLMTPYGQHQLTSKVYGGVVDELTEGDTAAVWIPDAPYEVQERIGELVVDAFEKKEEANAIEERTIKQFEQTIEQGA